ncbi:MAG: BtaA family protein [Puniceicoccales bacterium]|jgi:S-adenosylmethionine-diacylglycerol 3-amino-3-carboxypropyl transferase|nr:BtaA family protein [Puniceicoccales bacterium]
MSTEAAARVDFIQIRYAQCWEDADVLLSALNIQGTDTCLSIASAGDNALAMLGAGAERVIALDLNPSQLACLALRVAAYRELKHPELLELIGSRPSTRRLELYQRCRPLLNEDIREFWDDPLHSRLIEQGIGSAGKFENYFRLFRNRALPLVHGRCAINALLQGAATAEERHAFYDRHWNTWRWRMLFKVFFSRFVMGRLGRDPGFFKYVEGSVAEKILDRCHHALTELNPAENPYLHWILKGTHGDALPWALREENFDRIRSRLDRLEWHGMTIEDFLIRNSGTRIHKFNLSDIFEYMSPDNYTRLLERIIKAGCPGGRLAYWNMLAPRSRPESLKDRIQPLDALSRQLHQQDKAFFYSAFVVEELL